MLNGVNGTASNTHLNVSLNHGYKVCTRCKVEQNKTEFYVKSYGLQSWCKSCCNEYTREYHKINLNRLRSLKRKRQLERNYKLSWDDFTDLVSLQEGKCAICQSPEGDKLQVDHNHITGEVRGLLCFNCNSGLGQFKDNITYLDRAAQYLKES